jgi:hypothetical protein
MQYLLLCCINEKQWEALPESKRGGIMREYGELLQGLDASGRHLASGQLCSSSTAHTVRGRNGKTIVTDGPFAETKEQVGGYHLVECRDLDEALSIAKRIPTIPHGGTVEVRALLTQSVHDAECALTEGLK